MSVDNLLTANVKLPFNFAVGATASRFYQALRDEKVIYGTSCEACSKVIVPARSYCPTCNGAMAGWVKLPDTGTLLGWSEPENDGDSFVALIKLEGADNLLVHKLADNDPVMGIQVKAQWQEQRTGSLSDIEYFKVAR